MHPWHGIMLFMHRGGTIFWCFAQNIAKLGVHGFLFSIALSSYAALLDVLLGVLLLHKALCFKEWTTHTEPSCNLQNGPYATFIQQRHLVPPPPPPPTHTHTHMTAYFATGVPLKPMLAKISEGIPDAIKQLKGEPFLAEYKYDGTRAQIHLLPDNSVKVFSRNCEDKTVSMPDVVAAIQAAAKGILHLAFMLVLTLLDTCSQSTAACPSPPPCPPPPQLAPFMQSKVFMCACLLS